MSEPLVIERMLNAPSAQIWQALTDPDQMKKWYFDVPGFKAKTGYAFRFYAGNDNAKYLHECEVTTVVPGKKLAYSWRYEGYPGISYVSFELFDGGTATMLKLTHDGLESFPAGNADLAPDRFAEGWTYIIGKSLVEFLENKPD